MSPLESQAGASQRLDTRHGPRASAPRRVIESNPAPGTDAANITPAVKELALVASRVAFRADWDGGASEIEARNAVGAVCQAARNSGTPIEQLLIVLKAAWHQLPENRSRMDPATQATLARIVTICIHEYYRPRNSS